MRIKTAALFCTLLPALLSQAASDPIRYENYIYEPAIQTVMLTQAGSYERFPVVALGSSNQLNLQFDEMKAENDYYQFTFIHCNANWEPSNLRPNEYLAGNFFENINEYNYSTSTFNTFTHYNVNFPSAEMKPKVSGNFILKIYRNFDENDIIITRRFMVVAETFTIAGLANSATNPDSRFTKQEIDFTVTYGTYSVPNPMMDVTAVVLQNLRWDNAIYDLKPRFVNGGVLNYNYEKENLFDGGNEFRYFDVRSLRFLSMNVRRKYLENNVYHVVLYPDELRGNRPYLQTIDYNGKRVIDNRDGSNGEIEGDYCYAHFTLVSPKLEKDVYIFGELSDWQLQDSFKMEYNANAQQYERTVLVKQAYYNYYYVQESDNPQQHVDISKTEGNHMQTENDYHILIYHKNQFLKYDELLGTFHTNSRTR